MILEESVKKIIHKKSYFLYTGFMNDAEEFRKDREEQFGGEIGFLSYATLIGRPSSNELKNRGGILYQINDILHFEDFERSTGLMVLFNKKEKYKKTEFSINISDISIVKNVREKDAISCIQGGSKEEKVPPAPTGILGILSKSVLQLILNEESSIFLDLLDKEGFIDLVNEYMLSPE